MERLMSFVGFFVLIGIAWLVSLDRKQFPWRIVILGGGLQFLLAGFMLNTSYGEYLARRVIWLSQHYYYFIDRGAVAVTGESFYEFPLFLQTVPAILFAAATTSLLYHLRVLQVVVRWLAATTQRTFGLSGVESLVACASVFLGRVESLFLVRPFLVGLTNSEYHAILVCGFATISLASLAAVNRLGFNELHLFTAALISAPAGLVIAKVLVPETQIPATLGRVDVSPPRHGTTPTEALVLGAVDGVKVAVRVIAVAVVLFAILAMADRVLVQLGGYLGYPSRLPGEGWSLRTLLKYAFVPFAWLMGVSPKDCLPAGELLGLRFLATEFTAYVQLKEWSRGNSDVQLEPRTRLLLTYALCGFANVVTVGMQMAAIGVFAPDRHADVARLAWRALLGGTLACCMTACVAGVLV